MLIYFDGVEIKDTTKTEVMILPKEKLHVVYLFMPWQSTECRASNLNSAIFAELELKK